MSKNNIWDTPDDFSEFGVTPEKKLVSIEDATEPNGNETNPEPPVVKETEVHQSEVFDFDEKTVGDKPDEAVEGVEVKVEDGKPIEDELDPNDPKPSNVEDFSSLAGALKDYGVLNGIELKDGEVMTSDQLLELHKNEVDSRFDSMLEDYANSFDDDGKLFLEFKKNGGETSAFFERYKDLAKRPIYTANDDSSAESVARYYLKEVSALPMAEIEERLEFMKEKGRLHTTVSQYDTHLNQVDERKKQDLLSIEVENKKAYERNVQSFNESVKNSLFNADSFTEFPDFNSGHIMQNITKPIMKGENKGNTQLNVQLAALFSSNDKTKLAKLAYILDKDFDFSSLKSALKDGVISSEQKKIREIKVGLMGAGGSKNTNIKPLWERI